MSGDNKLQDDDGDLGTPIRELTLLRETPMAGFSGRIRNSIHRRIAAAESIDFSLVAPFQMFLNYLTAMLQAVFGEPSDQGKRR